MFKGGIAYGNGYETVELLLDKKNTKDDKLCLQAYDANLIGLPPVSKWSNEAQTELKNKVIERTKDYNIDVFVDGVSIKRKAF